MSDIGHCECCERYRRLVERYRKPIPDGGRTWQERAAVLKVKYVDADEQLRGAVEAERKRCAEIVRRKARPWNPGTPTRDVLDGILRDIGGQ